MYILNLTQHSASGEQREVGVVDLDPEGQRELAALLTFHSLPTRPEVNERARQIAGRAENAARAFGARAVMIGGAPFLMAPLQLQLRARGLEVLYAFSVRVSEERTEPDGSVRKVSVFRHAGFVPA